MSFGLQNQIKNNSTDIKNYIDDLYKWEAEITADKPKKSLKNPSDLPPIRGQAYSSEKASKSPDNSSAKPLKGSISEEISENGDFSKDISKETTNKYKRDANTVSDYYKAWDRFDVDKELLKLEPSEKPSQMPPKNAIINKVMAPANAKIIVKGGRNMNYDIDSLKDRANLHYHNFEYEKALELYSNCLEKYEEKLKSKGNFNEKFKNGVITDKFNEGIGEITDENAKKDLVAYSIILSNRAMTFIKLQDYVKAELDCDFSIKINPNFAKNYTRRALCRRKMGKLRLSEKDLKKALEFDDKNQEILKEIRQIEEIFKGRREKAKKNLIIPVRFSDKNTVKIEVEDKGFVKKFDENALKMTFNVEKTENNEEFQIKKKKNEENNGFLRIKEIDRIYRKNEKENMNYDEILRKKVKFAGKTDISINNLKKKAFDPENFPKKSIMKNSLKTVKNSKEKSKITLETVIEKGKLCVIGEILQETKGDFKLNSSQFLSHWKNLYHDKSASLAFLQVFQ